MLTTQVSEGFITTLNRRSEVPTNVAQSGYFPQPFA